MGWQRGGVPDAAAGGLRVTVTGRVNLPRVRRHPHLSAGLATARDVGRGHRETRDVDASAIDGPPVVIGAVVMPGRGARARCRATAGSPPEGLVRGVTRGRRDPALLEHPHHPGPTAIDYDPAPRVSRSPADVTRGDTIGRTAITPPGIDLIGMPLTAGLSPFDPGWCGPRIVRERGCRGSRQLRTPASGPAFSVNPMWPPRVLGRQARPAGGPGQ